MSLDPRSQSVALLNNIASLASQYLAWQQAVQALNAQVTALNSGNGASSYWRQFPTCAQNADGSLGTPDVSPSQTNPMNAPLIPGLTRALSYAGYNNGLTALTALAVTTTAQAQQLNALVGG